MPFLPLKALLPFGYSPSTSQDSQMHPFWKGIGAHLQTQELYNSEKLSSRKSCPWLSGWRGERFVSQRSHVADVMYTLLPLQTWRPQGSAC